MAETKPRRVILDVDVGTDDYLAMLIFFYAERIGLIKIDAIVCTMGNTTLDNVCNNVVRLLETVERTDIPVYRGGSKQLIPPEHTIKHYHGSDGFGNLQYDKDPDLSIIKPEPASVAIGKLILDNPNEISLICVGPLTNAALAIRLFDVFADSIKDMWIMGGNYTAVGNVTATAEFNFYIDPEAAHIVLSSIKKPIFILTWETCLSNKITFDWRFDVFGAKNNTAIQLLTQAEKNVYSSRKHKDFWYPCDAFLAAAFVYPDSIITKKSRHNATVELAGFQTRGQIVLDHLKTKEENVTIIEELNADVFKELLMKL